MDFLKPLHKIYSLHDSNRVFFIKLISISLLKFITSNFKCMLEGYKQAYVIGMRNKRIYSIMWVYLIQTKHDVQKKEHIWSFQSYKTFYNGFFFTRPWSFHNLLKRLSQILCNTLTCHVTTFHLLLHVWNTKKIFFWFTPLKFSKTLLVFDETAVEFRK